jgi:DNA-binding SARP family transcriptional activator/tetratricopeptide (TPR) repeat protein
VTGPAGLEFRLLGPLEVVRDGEPVDLPAGKARLLLAALLVNPNRVVSTDRLFEVLWGAEVPGSAQNLLQTYVSRLRDALEPERPRRAASGYLLTREPGYVLRVDADLIDAVRSERLAAEGRRALADAPDVAAAALRTALAMWRGDPLADFTFEPFAQADIARLTELRLAAYEDRLQADLALGAHAEVCGELTQLVAEHPLRERLWGHLMVALYRSDRQADALAAFRTVRATLVDQLGIEPSPALARLNQAILDHSLELEWAGATLEPQRLRIPAVAPRLDRLDETPPSKVPADALEQGRRALAARDWQRAFDLLSAADDGALAGEDLEGLAEAALWAGRPHESLAARQRAHDAFIEAGDRRRAAAVSVVLCLHHAARLHLAVAGGWFQRAQRLLEEEPECPEHGFAAWAAAMFSIGTNDLGAGLDHARRAYDIGCRFDVPDLQAVGLTFQGWVLVRQGQPARGLALMDEGMTWAVGGRLAPLVSALIFCRTIGTCFELGDYRRATEWMEAVADCFARTGIGAFPGDCEAHRVGILVGRGAWSEGELEARRACAQVERIDAAHTGQALHEIGEIRLRLGDLSGAADAFERAAATGASTQPGLAFLQLLRGDAAAAAASIEGALADTSDRLARARLLPAQLEIALAAGDVETARAASAELDDVAGVYGSHALAAAAACGRGALLLVDGDAQAAAVALREGMRLWQEASAPYDAARARLLLADALRGAGATSPALVELRAARSSFESLGARLEAQRAARLIDELAPVG